MSCRLDRKLGSRACAMPYLNEPLSQNQRKNISVIHTIFSRERRRTRTNAGATDGRLASAAMKLKAWVGWRRGSVTEDDRWVGDQQAIDAGFLSPIGKLVTMNVCPLACLSVQS